MTTDDREFRQLREIAPAASDTAASWRCPVRWHRHIKRHGDRVYCIEPGCDHSNVKQAESAR